MSATGNWASTLLRWLFLLEHFPKTMQLFDNDNFSRGWPLLRSPRTKGDCTRKLGPGGREGDLATTCLTCTSLSTSSSFSSSSEVSLILHTSDISCTGFEWFIKICLRPSSPLLSPRSLPARERRTWDRLFSRRRLSCLPGMRGALWVQR